MPSCHACCPKIQVPETERLVYHLDTTNISGLKTSTKDAAAKKTTSWVPIVGSSESVLTFFDFNTQSNWVGELSNSIDPPALLFDGINDYVSIPKSATKPLQETNAYSIEVYINPSKGLLGKGTIFAKGQDIKLAINSKSQLLVNDSETLLPIIPNSWNHIVLVKHENGLGELYLNGFLTWSTLDLPYIKLEDSTSIIGAEDIISKTTNFYKGKIALLRIYKTGLTPEKVTSVFDDAKFKFEGKKSFASSSSSGSFLPIFTSGNPDFIPPGIRVDFGLRDGFVPGQSFMVSVTDEGGNIFGSNPTSTIGDISCTIGGTNSFLTGSQTIPPRQSGLKFDGKKKVKTPLKGELRTWSIEALIKRNTVDLFSGSNLADTTSSSGNTASGNRTTQKLQVKGDGNAGDNNTLPGVTNQFETIFAGKDIGLYINNSILTIAGERIIPSGAFIDSQGWHHVVTSCDGRTTKFYLDGYIIGGGIPAQLNLDNATIGGNDKGETLNGAIANIRIYNRSLRFDEVAKNNRFRLDASDATGLIAEWKFEEKGGDIVQGWSPQGGFDAITSFGVRTQEYRVFPDQSLNSQLDNFNNSNYPGRGLDYEYNIKEYTFEVPSLGPDVPDQFQKVTCSASDVFRNTIQNEELGEILIFNTATKASTSSSSSGGSKKEVANCLCKGNNLELNTGYTTICLNGKVICNEGKVECCRGLTQSSSGKCLSNDPTIKCVLESDLSVSSSGKSSSGTGFGTSTAKGGSSTTSTISVIEEQEDENVELVEGGFIKFTGEKGSAKLLKKVACKESLGNFVIKGTDTFTGIPVDYTYSSSRLTIYKVEEGRTSFNLKLETELDTSTFLSDECTQGVKAAIAGPVIYNNITNELIVVDSHGVNIAKIYKVNFQKDKEKSTDSQLLLSEKGKLNLTYVYDGYTTDSTITPTYGKSHYLIFSQANETNYDHELLLFPIIEDQSIKLMVASDDSKEKSTGKKDKEEKPEQQFDLPEGAEQIVISLGTGLFNAGSGDPFAGTEGDSAGGSDTGKGKSDLSDDQKDKLKEAKDDLKDLKDKKTEKEASSSGDLAQSSSGLTSSSSGAPQKDEYACTESRDCAKHALENFCIKFNGIGKCINPYKISNKGQRRFRKCISNEISIQGYSTQELFCIPTGITLESTRSTPTTGNLRLSEPVTEPIINPDSLLQLPEIGPSKIKTDPKQLDQVPENKVYVPHRFFFGRKKETSLSQSLLA
ncbi:MAG: laminin G domain-containing protein, partial [Candidatus Melainabacteria bacterium]|nr:laminin G domain-containing protein [Candidatus Melainabacteria bacterium]